MVAKSHGQTMDEYMQAVADRVKKQSEKPLNHRHVFLLPHTQR